MKYMVLILFLLIPVTVSALTLTGKVVAIHDGDTLSIILEGTNKKSKLRLLGVDTPEIDFNGATQGEVALKARDYLISLLPLNSTIKIDLHEQGTDSNNRMLGTIIYQNQDINLAMLKAGWGAVYFIYPYDKKMVVNYMQASEIADQNDLGIFSDKYKSQALAYVFRQQVKNVPGTNFVANFVTKKLYSSEDIELIPHFQRVFFSSEEMARMRGFNW